MTNWKRATAGRPLRPSAATWNGLIDAAQAWLGRAPTTGTKQADHPPSRAWLKNTGAATIPAFAWLEITGHATEHTISGGLGDGAGADFDPLPYLLGQLCAGETGPARRGAYAVAQEPIEPGGTGKIIVRGLTWAKAYQEHANTADGSYLSPTGPHISTGSAERQPTGPGRILFCAGDTGPAGTNDLAFIILEDPPTATTRWAETCVNDDHPTYPDEGNVVLVRFGKCAPSPLTTGNTAAKNFVADDPDEYALAVLENSSIPPQGQIVRCFLRDSQWWILESNVRFGYANETIAPGDTSKTVRLYRYPSDQYQITQAHYTLADDGARTIQEDDELWIVWMEDLTGGGWYILPTGGGTSTPGHEAAYFFEAAAYNDEDEATDRHSAADTTGSVYWRQSTGDLTANNLTVNPATTFADYAFKATAAGWYEFDWTGTLVDDSDAATDYKHTVQTTAAGGLSDHTHNIDLGTPSTDNGTPTQSHFHTITPSLSGTATMAGQAADHTHDVDLPRLNFGTHAYLWLVKRTAGGGENDWSTIADAGATLGEYRSIGGINSLTTHTIRARCRAYLYANDEIATRLWATGENLLEEMAGKAWYKILLEAYHQNLTIKYLGAELPTATHYPAP